MDIRGYLTLHLKILVRNDMDVKEHQGLSNIRLKTQIKVKEPLLLFHISQSH